MNGRILTALVCSLALCGCGERTYTEDEQNEKAALSLISALSTNASVRAIRASGAVRDCLKRLTTPHERETLLVSWRDALKKIQVEQLRPSERYWSVREACHVLVWDYVCSLQDSGGSYEEMWQSYLDTLTWLDSQIAKMKPDIDGRCERRKAHECWDSYQALAEYRESVIENLEIDEFDKGRYPNDIDKMDAIRAKFEKLIGRPVRKREDITRLGFYAKRARARIQAERDAALGTTRRCGTDGK